MKRLEILVNGTSFRSPSRKTKSPLTDESGRKRRPQFSGTSGKLHYVVFCSFRSVQAVLFGIVMLSASNKAKMRGWIFVLFHVTARHSFDQCGMYNEEVRKDLHVFLPLVQPLCEEHSVKLHYVVTGHPEHVFYLLVEAEDSGSLCSVLTAIPMKQEFDIKPVRFLNMNQF